jgi:hypothetical protein
VIASDQMLNSYGEGTTKKEFASMSSKSIFSPQDSIDNVLQGVTHEHIHREVTFILGHGEKCSLKEESNALPSNLHLDSLAGGTEDLRFDQNALSVDL